MEKTFDAVGWMRQQRIRIDRETEGFSWEERRAWIRKELEGDPLWEYLRDRLVNLKDARRLAETRR